MKENIHSVCSQWSNEKYHDCVSYIPAVIAGNNPEDSEKRVYMMANKDVVLPCGLVNTTHELPVMWFKDGLLVSTITSGKTRTKLLNVYSPPRIVYILYLQY